jgi:TonB family protein
MKGNRDSTSFVLYSTRVWLGDYLRPLLRSIFIFVFILAWREVPAGQQKDSAHTQKDSTKQAQEIYTVGGDVKPPKIIHYVEPDPTAQDTYVEGIVRISAVVNLDGQPAELHVVKGLNEEEDKLALDALKQWRFKPGTKNGQPVRVKINVEINFHLL